MIFDGFGIHAKLVADVHPDPQTGQLTMTVDRPPAGALRRVRPAPVRLRPRPDGDADPLHASTGAEARCLRPWNAPAGAAALGADRQHHLRARTAGPARARCAPSTRASSPEPRTRVAGDFSAFTLKLDRDDGDQFLGDLNFKLPPGFTGNLRGISYCPEGAIAAAAQNARPRRAGRAELPGLEPGRHDQRRRRPRQPPVPRGREDVPGRALQGRAALGRRGHPGAGRALRLRRRRRPGRPARRPADGPGHRASPTRCRAIIGGIPIRMRSIQVNIDKPNFTINPTNC